jgi:hypothetical protein
VIATEQAITVPYVVFALRRESMFFRRAFPHLRWFPGAPCRAQLCGPFAHPVLMLETGLGASAMAAALRWGLAEPRLGDQVFRPRFLLSVGFSGALRSAQHVGELILANEVVDLEGNCWKTLCPEVCSEMDSLPRGRLLTTSDLVSDPATKRRLGQRYQACAVDMESASAARLCQEYGVPFVCLRVVSDELRTPLSPHLVGLLRQGRASPLLLASKLIRHPTLLGELIRLARDTRLAARRLLAVRTFLTR